MPSPVVTPNMALTAPGVSVTSSPSWALLLNADLSTIDQHDHSPGKGVAIGPSGLNISTDLSFQGNNLTHLNSLIFNGAVSGTPSTLSVYSNGVDLFYKDSAGNSIKLTANGGPNAGVGNISGLPSTPSGGAGIAWINASSTFQHLLDSGSVGANIDAGTYILRYPGSYPTPSGNYIALQAPSSLAAGISYTLPGTLPGTANALLLTNASGAQSFLAQGSANQVLAMNSGGTAPNYQKLTQANMGSLGQQISSSSGAFTTSNSTFTAVTNLSVTITTNGRPVMVVLQSDGANAALPYQVNTTSSSSGELGIFRGATPVGYYTIPATTVQTLGNVLIMDAVGAGTYTYTVQVKTFGTGAISVVSAVLVAYEL